MSTTTTERQAEAAIAYMMDLGDECAKMGEKAFEYAKEKVAGGTHYGRGNGETGDPVTLFKTRLEQLPEIVRHVAFRVGFPARLLAVHYGKQDAAETAQATQALAALSSVHESLATLADVLGCATLAGELRTRA